MSLKTKQKTKNIIFFFLNKMDLSYIPGYTPPHV